MSKKRRKKRNTVSNYNNFNQLKKANIYLHKLDMHKNLIHILNKILSYDKDVIAKRILNDNETKSISSNVNWLNITTSPDHISYTTKDLVKNQNDQWKKENRKPVLIKKLIKKIYGKSFSNRQVKLFLSKYKKAYNEIISYKKSNKNIPKDDKIIFKVIDQTVNEEIKWYINEKNNNYIKYTTYLLISDYKSIQMNCYEMFMDSKPFINFKLIDDFKKKETFIKSIVDSEDKVNDLIEFIKISID